MKHLIWIALFLLVGCQTAPLTHFNEVKKGMSKDQVLELVGNPQASARSDGKDRWKYGEREIQFENGKVIYVGEVVGPKTSADEQDRLNETNLRDWERDAVTNPPVYEEVK